VTAHEAWPGHHTQVQGRQSLFVLCGDRTSEARKDKRCPTKITNFLLNKKVYSYMCFFLLLFRSN
jgi:hypothetical protein